LGALLSGHVGETFSRGLCQSTHYQWQKIQTASIYLEAKCSNK
jgi:hypothetical protein